MIIYKSAVVYIQSCTTVKARIAAIDQIIDALLNQALASIETGSSGSNTLSQYSLNDGQTVISASYRSSSEIKKDIQSYQDLRDVFLASYHNSSGRMVRLVDHKSFPNGF
jgi:hypothetical protein